MVGPSAVAVASETFQGSGVVEGLDALLSASVNTDATFTALSRVTMRWTNEELLLAVQGISMCIYAYKGRKFNEKYTNIDYSSLRMRRLWLWQFKIGTHELLLSFWADLRCAPSNVLSFQHYYLAQKYRHRRFEQYICKNKKLIGKLMRFRNYIKFLIKWHQPRSSKSKRLEMADKTRLRLQRRNSQKNCS